MAWFFLLYKLFIRYFHGFIYLLCCMVFLVVHAFYPLYTSILMIYFKVFKEYYIFNPVNFVLALKGSKSI